MKKEVKSWFGTRDFEKKAIYIHIFTRYREKEGSCVSVYVFVCLGGVVWKRGHFKKWSCSIWSVLSSTSSPFPKLLLSPLPFNFFSLLCLLVPPPIAGFSRRRLPSLTCFPLFQGKTTLFSFATFLFFFRESLSVPGYELKDTRKVFAFFIQLQGLEFIFFCLFPFSWREYSNSLRDYFPARWDAGEAIRPFIWAGKKGCNFWRRENKRRIWRFQRPPEISLLTPTPPLMVTLLHLFRAICTHSSSFSRAFFLMKRSCSL